MADSLPSSARKRVLVIGGGRMGRRHLEMLAASRQVSLWCVEPSDPALQECRRLFTLAGSFSSLADADMVALDGAIVATPADSHLTAARWCVRHRLPFLLEKPIAVDETGVGELITAAESSGIPAGVAYPRRYSPAAQILRDRIAAGEIGEPKLVHTIFSQDYRRYRPDYARIYYAKLATGGGALMDALSHHVDFATRFLGRVAGVHCFHQRMVFAECEGEDTAMINLRFANGALGSVQGNQFQKPNVDFIELVGTDGNLRYERVSGVLSFYDRRTDGWSHLSVPGSWDDILARQTQAFLRVLDGKGRFETDLRDGWHTLQIVLAARQAEATGQTQTLDRHR